jgi:PrtD family type I secretion system ABC transporter
MSKRKAGWTIRRLLAAASGELAPRRLPHSVVRRKQPAEPVPGPPLPSRRAPAPPAQDCNRPREELAAIVNNKPSASRRGSPGEERHWGMPILDWGDRTGSEHAPDAVPRRAARPRPSPEPAPSRPFHSFHAQGPAGYAVQHSIPEASRQYWEALTEPPRRDRSPEARRRMGPKHPAQAKPSTPKPKPGRRRAPTIETHRVETVPTARPEDAVTKARRRYLDKIRRQRAAIQARLQYILAELHYKAPRPPLLPHLDGAPRADATIPAEAQQTQADDTGPRPDVITAAIRSVTGAAIAAGLFSLFANILTLGGLMFMVGAYEFNSDSMAMLLTVGALVAGLSCAIALLNIIRNQIIKAGARRLAVGNGIPEGPRRDLVSLRQFLCGSGPATFLDLPWAPVSLLIIGMMHWSLSVITGIGMLVMAAIASTSEKNTRALLGDARRAYDEAGRLAKQTADVAVTRWYEARQRADAAMRAAGECMAAFASTATMIRMVIQSVLLAAGGMLLFENEISLGVMIAVPIIGGKAIGPVAGAVLQWRGLISARNAFLRLEIFRKRYPAQTKRLPPPTPKGRIEVRDLTMTSADASAPALRQISFTLEPGKALGVIGADAAGQSALARALTGQDVPHCGWVRLDATDLRMLSRDELGRKIGHLPQTVELSDGTVGENIAGFDPHTTHDAIVRAAKTVGIHTMIASLPDRYDFRVGENGLWLSAAERQGLGLARAVFGNPALVVLDEPADLDGPGKAALHRTLIALKASRTTVILLTRRPDALIAVDYILVLEDGKHSAFGRTSRMLEALACKGDKSVRTHPETERGRKAQQHRPTTVTPTPR